MFKLVKFTIKDIFRTKASVILILGIIFSFVIPMVVLMVSNTLMSNALLQSKYVYGEFTHILYNSNEKQDDFLMDYNVERMGVVAVLGKANISGYSDNDFFGYIDETGAELTNFKLMDGRFPINSNEVAVTVSLMYELGYQDSDERFIEINNKDYEIVGIISDYSATWNTPDYTPIVPRILLSKADSLEFNTPITTHFLLDVEEVIDSKEYLENKDLVQNVNQIISGNTKDIYRVPGGIMFLIIMCGLTMNLYIMAFYFNKQKTNIGVLKCMNFTNLKCAAYLSLKIFILWIFSILFGSILSFAFTKLVLIVLNTFIEIDAGIIFYRNDVVFLVITSLLIVAISSISPIKKIMKTKPIEYIANEKNGVVNSKARKYKKTTIRRIALFDLKHNIKNSIITILLFSVCFSLFNYYYIYISMYADQKSEANGKMLLDFDYEFLCEQTIIDSKFVDEDGVSNTIASSWQEDSVLFMYDYNKLISPEIIKTIENDKDIEKVKSYSEAHRLLMLDYPNNEYTNNFISNEAIGDNIKEQFNINGSSEIQMMSYTTEDLLAFEEYVLEGEVNIDKIISGEEVILMAPIYQITKTDEGFTVFDFINRDLYNGSENQFRDDYFKAGDEITISQLAPNDFAVKGYLNQEQIDKYVELVDHTFKIGAIIDRRVGWFDSMISMPNAYTLLCHNETFDNIDISPVYSRVRLYLNPSVKFEDFQPNIDSYRKLLDDCFFRNNAAEMTAFREYKLLLSLMVNTVVIVLTILIFIVLLIQNNAMLVEKRGHFALLKINGLDNKEITKILIIQKLIIATLSMGVSLIVCIGVFKYSFAGIWDLGEYVNIRVFLISMSSLYVIELLSIISVIKTLTQNTIIEIMDKN